MSNKTAVRLSPGRRLARGLQYTAVGPVDVTRGALGVGLNSAQSSAVWAGKRYRNSKLRKDLKQNVARNLATAQDALADELAAAQDTLSNLPQTLDKARRPKRRSRPLVLAGVGVAVLAVGAATFSIVRRSTQPEPSPLPPSVDVAPRP